MKLRQILSITAISGFFLLGTEVQATPSQAMVTMVALSPPKIAATKGGGDVYVAYNVCNNRKKALGRIIPRSIPGVQFQPATFALERSQCRMLKLTINPDLMPAEGISHGPILQLAQQKSSLASEFVLENNFWDILPSEEEALYVVSLLENNPIIPIPVLYRLVIASLQRDSADSSRSRYPGYAIINNIGSYTATFSQPSIEGSFSIREEEEGTCSASLGADQSCLLAIDANSTTGIDGRLRVSGFYDPGIIGSGVAFLFGANTQEITSTPSDLSALHLSKDTPLVITIQGASNPPYMFMGLRFLRQLSSFTTTSNESGGYTLTLETDSTVVVEATDFYIQAIDEPASIALKGKISLN
ncbi:MAG: hypothetical protein K0U37_08790 [Gammaproteobacteria bacterium]|nr:hypothetical protein [Gammaproteobacteria bacterium]